LFDTTEGAIVAATAQEILQGLAEIVNERAGVPTEDVELGKSFADDLGVDELGMVEVVMAIEERFDVTIADEAINDLTTVGDAADYILEHQS
jgi:acyl carrier protein